MNFTNILFCTFFQVALDKSKHNQISSRKSFYLDNLKLFRKANFCKLQSHSKTITENRSLYFFQTKIRKSNHYSSISQSNSPPISPITSHILICNGISKYQVTWWTNFWSPWNHQRTVRPAYFNWFWFIHLILTAKFGKTHLKRRTKKQSRVLLQHIR